MGELRRSTPSTPTRSYCNTYQHVFTEYITPHCDAKVSRSARECPVIVQKCLFFRASFLDITEVQMADKTSNALAQNVSSLRCGGTAWDSVMWFGELPISDQKLHGQLLAMCSRWYIFCAGPYISKSDKSNLIGSFV